ncbi:MAG: anaerobic ribonucleoside-triphosphate reductase activating protein [Ruminococcus sp.]|jgi:anaerobic ribonucleoside-triphosphate reductase activating protein|nr:anaerobic ribonucleoside-triphosphate reductase activating protein [uncultured Schaedlerella sp.]MCI9211918.1 anaerobic ribonucleoside-triphosphate reductase activating protein [Ruminococcus sp.]
MQYHNITKDDMLNGEGLRVVLWVAGCSHACPGCHNPVTWDPKGGLEFDRAARQELFDQLEHSYINGITYSGGDPLYVGNREAIAELASEIRARYPRKTQWLYTGYQWEEIRGERVVPYLDAVVDGRYVEAEKDSLLPWRGSKNQRVIDVQKSLKAGETICRE